MEYSSKDLRRSGVYIIRNTLNGKVYVGSAYCFDQRWRVHRWCLENNCHKNPYLQKAWQKYGSESFIFEILEIVDDRSVLLDKEQEWLDKLRPFKKGIGYNICPKAGNWAGRKHSPATKDKLRYPRSIDHRRKLSEALIGKPLSNETRLNMSKGRIGRPLPEKQKLNISQTLAKEYSITDPKGNTFLIKGLSRFCEENNLSLGVMVSVARGRREHHKGWKCAYVNPDDLLQTKKARRKYIVVNPNGESWIVENLRKFCRETGVNRVSLWRVANGLIDHYQGWRCYYQDRESTEGLMCYDSGYLTEAGPAGCDSVKCIIQEQKPES